MSRRIRVALAVASLLTISAVGLALAETGASGATDAAKSATSTEAAKPAATTAHHAKHHGTMMRIDLNSASKEQLTKLSGVDDAMADKIIAARPFKAKSELLSKSILTKAEYQKVASHLMVKPAKS